VEHLHHFGLTQDPFSNEPDLRFYFESDSHRDAQRRVERGLRQRKGLTLLTGDGGMGKTLLARRILDALEEEVFEATLLVMLPGAADATGILQRFARQLGAEEPAGDRAGLLGQIYEQLAIVREDGRHAVLMVDDAQVMSPEVFSELGGLVNLEYEDRRLLSILFVGSPELDRLVENDPGISARVDVRVRLQALDLSNATKYLEHRLAAVNGKAGILPPAAIDALFKFGRGRPRLLNTLSDNGLFEAYLAGRTSIEAHDIERAASDLGIGPDPGSTYSQSPTVMSDPPSPVPSPVPIDSSSAPLDEGSFSLDEAIEEECEAVADLDLTPSMTIEAEAVPSATPTIDLDAGLEAALEDFDSDLSDVPVEAASSQMDLSDSLVFEEEPASADAAEVPVVESVNSSEGGIPDGIQSVSASENDVLVGIELSPIEAGDSDEFDDVFVELIEE